MADITSPPTCPPGSNQRKEDEAMKSPVSLRRYIPGIIVLAIFAALAPLAHAEVMRVDIVSTQDVLGGKAFGMTGAYEKLVGKIYFAVDPNNPHNRIIADIDKAPKNAQGK